MRTLQHTLKVARVGHRSSNDQSNKKGTLAGIRTPQLYLLRVCLHAGQVLLKWDGRVGGGAGSTPPAAGG